jgi:hypothetical protein
LRRTPPSKVGRDVTKTTHLTRTQVPAAADPPLRHFPGRSGSAEHSGARWAPEVREATTEA